MKYSATAAINAQRGAPVLLGGDLCSSLEICAKTGYEGMEIHIRSSEDVDANDISECSLKNGIKITTIGTGPGYVLDGLCLTHWDNNKRKEAVERLKGHIRLASLLRSKVIIGSMQGRLPDGPEKNTSYLHFKDCMKELCDYAAGKDITLLLEAINRYEMNFHNTADEILGFVDEMGCGGLKILLDTFHMNIEETCLTDSILKCGDRLGHIHLADSNRKRPGLGHIDFTSVLKALHEVKYTGYAAFECLPWPEPERAAEEALKHMKCLEISQGCGIDSKKR